MAAILSLCLVLSLAGVVGAEVWTDKWLYEQGETVQINGDGMQPGETVVVEVLLPDGTLSQRHEVVADDAGGFADTYVLALDAPGGIYDVVAIGQSSGAVFTTQFDPPSLDLFTTSAYTTERTVFPRGATVHAKLSDPNTSKYYKFEVLDPSGAQEQVSACVAGASSLTNSYAIAATDPLSGSSSWTYRTLKYDNSTCSSGEDVYKSEPFWVAHTWAFSSTTNRDLCTTDAACDANDKPYWMPGSATIYLRTRGLPPSAEYNPDWLTPSPAVFCQNDKTASSASGVLDLALCATPTLAADEGQWKLFLERHPTTQAQTNVTLNSFVLDATAPDTTITFPTNTSYTAATWTAGCSTAAVDDFCGTATDPVSNGVASGVATVEYSIKRVSDNKYWSGTAFADATETWLTATGTTSWSQAFASSNLGAGAYTIRAKATDHAGNVDATPASVTFTFTVASAYTVTFNQPIDGSGIINKGKYGRVIPVKVNLYLNGSLVDDGTGGPLSIGSSVSPCTAAASDTVESYSPGSSDHGTEFRWDGTQWIYNLDTTRLPNSAPNKCFKVSVIRDSTAIGSFNILLTK